MIMSLTRRSIAPRWLRVIASAWVGIAGVEDGVAVVFAHSLDERADGAVVFCDEDRLAAARGRFSGSGAGGAEAAVCVRSGR